VVAIIITIGITTILIIAVGEISAVIVTTLLLRQLVILSLNLVSKQTQLLQTMATPAITYLNSLDNQALLRQQQQAAITRSMPLTSLRMNHPRSSSSSNNNSLTQIQVVTTTIETLIKMEIFGNSLKGTMTIQIAKPHRSNR